MQDYINDEHFMCRVRDGDLDSLVPLFEKYHVRIYNFYLRLTRSKELSEDLTQDVFNRVIRYKDSFKEDSRFKPWIYQVARNLLNDYHRKKHEYYTEQDDVSMLLDNPGEAKDDFDKTQRQQALMEAIGFLNDDDKEILELSRFQDLKYEEISQITGSSVGAIKVKVHRAINKLREIYFQIA
jgi:RNA polymerase sigma-70 factor (ECF subfamily)